MKSLSVRLDPEDARKAAALRKAGVRISSLVRDAIRAEFDRQRKLKRRGRIPSDIVQQIMARYPTPLGTPPRAYNVHDRREARAAILEKLRGARRRSG